MSENTRSRLHRSNRSSPAGAPAGAARIRHAVEHRKEKWAAVTALRSTGHYLRDLTGILSLNVPDHPDHYFSL